MLLVGLLLPNGKLIFYDDDLYQSNLQRILTEVDYDNLNKSFVKLYIGHYNGNQTTGSSNPPRYISIGAKIQVVFVYSIDGGFDNGGHTYGGMAINEYPSQNEYISISGNGFYVQNSQSKTAYDGSNLNNVSYSYIAL